MAQKVTVILEDDLTGGPAGQTIRFAFEGTDYEIDLNAKRASAIQTASGISSAGSPGEEAASAINVPPWWNGPGLRSPVRQAWASPAEVVGVNGA